MVRGSTTIFFDGYPNGSPHQLTAHTPPPHQKTFYAGGDQFVSTDDGHHYGLVMGDLGAAYGDKWAERDRHFLFTELTLLHFQNPPYDEWYERTTY